MSVSVSCLPTIRPSGRLTNNLDTSTQSSAFLAISPHSNPSPLQDFANRAIYLRFNLQGLYCNVKPRTLHVYCTRGTLDFWLPWINHCFTVQSYDWTKKLKTDMMFENSFKKFKCFWEIIIYFNFATKCHSFHKIALLLKVLMIFGHF